MMKKQLFIIGLIFSTLFLQQKAWSQIDEDQFGNWYMYFWNTTLDEGPWGFQGDIQYRNWNIIGDLEQLLLRGGVTYQPKALKVKFTLGYGYVSTGAFGDSDETTQESRIYQEALLPQQIGERTYLTHRFRYEQRWVENQDFRTRFRYNLFITVPFNHKTLVPKTIYLSLYNELFINGQLDIGNSNEVEWFDRNRTYGGIGYVIQKGINVQVGVMRQTTNNWEKWQGQLSLHHTF